MPVPVITDPGTTIEILGRFFATFQEATYFLQTYGVDTTELVEQGITTLEQLKEALANDQIVPLTMQQEVLVGFGKVNAVDPTTTNAVSTSVVTDITATGGAVTAYTVSTGKTYTLVTRVAALTAALSLLASTVMAGGVATAVREQLLFTLDPYTIDGENVLAILDEDGNMYFMEGMIEAVREALVDMGFYDQLAPIENDVIIGGKARTNLDEWSNYTVYKNFFNTLVSNGRPIEHIVYDISSDNYRYVTRKTVISDYNGNSVDAVADYLLVLRGNYNGNSSILCYWVFKQSTFRQYAPNYDLYSVTNGNTPLCDADGNTVSSVASTKTPWLTFRDPVTHEVYLVHGAAGPYYSFIDSNPDLFASLPDSNFNFAQIDLDGRATAMAYYFMRASDTGIEGMTPNSYTEAILKDLTNPFTDAFPNIGTGIQTATPTDDDLEEKTTWYPINVTTNDAFTDGLTSEQTDYETVTDGEVSPDMQPSVLEGLKDLIEELLRDPENPTEVVYPTIPVGDSGDTPPENPTLLSGSANGLWKIYNPQLADIQAFGSWLWSSSIIDQITRMFNSPIDAVIALHQIYCTPARGGSANIMCGFLDSGVSSTYTVSNQYAEIDCGTIHIDEYYGTAVDYAYTKIAIYLPFIGIMPLSASVVMGSDLNVLYRIDVLTGVCLAQVKVIKQNSDAVMYTFEGNCACQIPLTASTYTGTVSALVNGVQAGLSLFMGDVVSAAGEVGSMLASSQTGLSGTKQSGALGANAGALGIRIPYVIITHPTVYDAFQYNTQYGFPSNKTVTLGSCSGFTEVKDIHLHGIPCTDDELMEIERLLKEGVIIN